MILKNTEAISYSLRRAVATTLATLIAIPYKARDLIIIDRANNIEINSSKKNEDSIKNSSSISKPSTDLIKQSAVYSLTMNELMIQICKLYLKSIPP